MIDGILWSFAGVCIPIVLIFITKVINKKKIKLENETLLKDFIHMLILWVLVIFFISICRKR